MDAREYQAQREVARQLIEIVGETPLVAELLRQAEVEEAISILREIAAERHVELPEPLAA